MGGPEEDFRIRFAVFELDTRSGELRKAGTRIRLQDQPLKILIALMEQPGEVVTREELKRRIWPDDSFGDFDHAVNVAVAKLRAALGDSADVPRYVETLPRRGYRFIFPVTFPKTLDSGAPSGEAEAEVKPTKSSTRFGMGGSHWCNNCDRRTDRGRLVVFLAQDTRADAAQRRTAGWRRN